MSRESPFAVCIVGCGHGYGNGHFLRMLSLQESLKKYGIKLSILTSFEKCHESSRVVILDKRDGGFPGKVLVNKKNILIAIDNRGLGRQEADIVWDTLPHIAMNSHEFKASLRKVLLPSYLTQKKSMVDSAQVIYSPTFYTYRKNDSTNNKSEMISLEDQRYYIKDLIRKDQIHAYFGQQLFEAIYLGKLIKLYYISSYHQMLATWFIKKWRGLDKAKFYFDGQGMQRLTKLILGT